MTKIRQLPSTVIILALVALVVVPLLALLQYQWLGRLAGQEYERIRMGIRGSMVRGAMQCNREFLDLLHALSDPDGVSSFIDEREMARRLAGLSARAPHRNFVSGTVKTIPAPKSETAVGLEVGSGRSIFVFNDLSMIGIAEAERRDSIVGVSLDRHYIIERYIPDVLNSHIGTEYAIPIRVVLFDSQREPLGSVSGDEDNPVEERVPILMFPRAASARMLFDSVGRPWQELIPRSRGTRLDPPRSIASPPFPMPGDSALRSGFFGRALVSAGISFGQGSLEEAVQSSRVNNLMLSFGILLLLSFTIAFLLRTTAKAQQLARQQLEFVAGVSHELRTPLAILRSAGENLSDGLIRNPLRAKAYGEVIKSEVGRLTDMVEKSLTYAGILSGESPMHRRLVDLSTILESAIRSTRQSRDGQNYEFRVSLEPGLPELPADPDVLRTVFENLLGNAVKYGNNKGFIDVAARLERNGDGKCLNVSVADHGIGIPAKEIGRVFDPFVRGRNATNKQIRGSGLGLSLAKHAVEAHGGTLTARSEEGSGSVFTVRLPLPQTIRDHRE